MEHGHIEETDQYFYHSDHLGSSAYITDKKGKVSQFVVYLPFGESLIDKHVSPDVMPYKFNGKEKDEETGLYYYGARYYNDRDVLWMGVDPSWEKYPNISPYVYCANNPVKLVDPDGENPLVGALVGGLMDYGLQVTTNYMSGKTGADAWTDVDMTSIAVSAVSGAAGVGLASKVNQVAKMAKLGNTATQVVKAAGEAAVDASISAGSQLIENGEVSLEKVAVDVAAGMIGSKLGGNVKTAKQASSEGKTLARQADRAKRVAGDNPRQSRAQKATEATKKSENYGNKTATATSVATSTVVSKATGKVLDNDERKN